MNIQSIIELSDLAKNDASGYPRRRPLLDVVAGQKGKHFNGIIGPRGVGKTILLKQLAAQDPHAVYISTDTLESDADVFEIVKQLNADYGYTTILLDEAHFLSNITESLKKTYDFLDVKIVFTSSIALALTQSAHDLSRRVILHHLYPFSYREYLAFRHGIELKPLSFDQLIDAAWAPDYMRTEPYFDDYLRGGLMPFALEESQPLKILTNVLETIFEKDIPRVARLNVDEIQSIRKMTAFIGKSAVDGINYSTLSNNLGITKYKAEQYTELLEKSFVLQRIFPKGTNVLREPKVLMALPYRLLFRDFDDALGGLREDYFAEAMRHLNKPISYLKSTRGSKTPDYVIEDADFSDIVIEIGGKGKGRQQFKDFSADRKIVLTHGGKADGIKRPLFMLGFLT